MLQLPSGSRTRVSRRIAADPTSTALLLAAPTAVDLWPGVRRVGQTADSVLVEAEPPAVPAPATTHPALVAVRALPPRRTPTAYVTRFAWSGASLPSVTGQLTLAYAPTADGTPVTHAVLELEVDDPAGKSVDGAVDGATDAYGGRALTAMAEGFLDNLARAAEARNRAA